VFAPEVDLAQQPSMPPDLARRLWAREYFQRIAGTGPVGGGLETDLFAGLE
jgi:hypothetical protein